MKRAGAIAVLLGCLLALPACGGSAGNEPQAGLSFASGSDVSAATQTFLERVAAAPAEVAYTATRRVFYEYPLGEGIATLTYTERVVSDGTGRFAIDPLEVESPALPTDERERFELTQKSREAFFHRYRDFRIEDLPLFLRTYELEDTGAQPVIAGRACVELAIRRIAPAPTWHRAAIDEETGLVLRCEEIDASGRVVGRVECLDLVLGADPATEFHVDLAASPLDLASDTVPQIGFDVLVPRRVPAGFVLRKAEKVADGEGGEWARLVYGDGAAELFLLHTDVAQLASEEPGPDPALDRYSVRVMQVGPWAVAQGFLGNDRVIAMGKLAIEDLLRTIESALP